MESIVFHFSRMEIISGHKLMRKPQFLKGINVLARDLRAFRKSKPGVRYSRTMHLRSFKVGTFDVPVKKFKSTRFSYNLATRLDPHQPQLALTASPQGMNNALQPPRSCLTTYSMSIPSSSRPKRPAQKVTGQSSPRS